MTRPYVCWAALGTALVALGFSLAAFSMSLITLTGRG